MNAYIVSAYRTPVTRAKKGGFSTLRSDELAARVIRHIMDHQPNIHAEQIDDVIVGNAVPEAEQGMQMGRMISLLALGEQAPGMIVNRYCGSGLEAIHLASARIHAGLADCMIAGGTESMSMVPMMGHKPAVHFDLVHDYPEYFLNMGLTAEELANDYHISREDSDAFAYQSHQKALQAIKENRFKEECLEVSVTTKLLVGNRAEEKTFVVREDEGPRADTSLEALAKLQPVFRKNGQVTAGNSSQTSDGAAFVMIVSEEYVKKYNLQPMARLLSYATVGVNPRIMGIGPVKAISKSLQLAHLSLQDISRIELNEAFACQALGVMQEASLNPDIVNMDGGAIALGHPLGCTGAKLSVQIIHALKRNKQKYGMVTACVGGGQGVAGIYEIF